MQLETWVALSTPTFAMAPVQLRRWGRCVSIPVFTGAAGKRTALFGLLWFAGRSETVLRAATYHRNTIDGLHPMTRLGRARSQPTRDGMLAELRNGC